jgi:pimeloyl-[acyl-carrier protein] methyl ester esterase
MSSLHSRFYPASRTDAVHLVLVHGWGLAGAVWHALLPHLRAFADVTVIERAGYGGSAGVSPDHEVEALLAVAPEQAVYVGWSLGFALIAELALRHPQRVQALVAVAVNPCFVKRSDWFCAMPETVFEQFQQQVALDTTSTLKRFVALQCHGSASQKQDIRTLNYVLMTEPQPAAEVLQHGLQQLAEQDLRPVLAQLTCPLLWVLGNRDALVPFAVGADLTDGNITVATIPFAAHVPHISHPELTAGHIRAFIQELQR